MKTFQILLALIHKDKRYPSSKEDFASKLKGIFGGNSMILPLPDDAPIEIPAITLSEKDSFEIRISRARTELILIDKSDSETELKNIVIEKITALLDLLYEENFIFTQMGYLIQAKEKIISPNTTIKKLFNENNKAIEELVDFTEQSEVLFRNLKKTDEIINNNSFRLNRILQVATNVQVPNEDEIPLLIDYDINTFRTKDPVNIDIETITAFIGSVNESHSKDVQILLEAITENE